MKDVCIKFDFIAKMSHFNITWFPVLTSSVGGVCPGFYLGLSRLSGDVILRWQHHRRDRTVFRRTKQRHGDRGL